MPQHTTKERRKNRVAAIKQQEGREAPAVIINNPRARQRKRKPTKRGAKGVLKGATFE